MAPDIYLTVYDKTDSGGAEENSYEEMTMAEIMTGKKGTFDETYLLYKLSF